MKKWTIRVIVTLIASYLAANSSWLQAASYLIVSDECDAELMHSAQTRVIKFYGQIESEPLFVCSNSPENWLNVQHGQTRFAAGLPALVIIGPSGANVDVIAHEWSHAELFARSGFIRRELHVPTWFDEGMAMQVDHRSDYNLEALSGYHANSLVNPVEAAQIVDSEFFTAAPQGKYHYALSRCLVSLWVDSNRDFAKRLNNWTRRHSDLAFENGIQTCSNM